MAFEKMMKDALASRVAVYVPGTVDADVEDAATAARMVEDVASELALLFGGATVTPARGAWYSDALHKLIFEDVNIVYAFCTPGQLDAAAERIAALARRVRDEMRQEAVSVEANGQLMFF